MEQSRLALKERSVGEALLHRRLDVEKIGHEQRKLNAELQQSASEFKKILAQNREVGISSAPLHGKNLNALLRHIDGKRALQERISSNKERVSVIAAQCKTLYAQRTKISALIDRQRSQRLLRAERAFEEANLELFTRKVAPILTQAPAVSNFIPETLRAGPTISEPQAIAARPAPSQVSAALFEISPGSFQLNCTLGEKELTFVLQNVQPGLVRINLEKQALLPEEQRRELFQCIERELSRRGLRITRERERRKNARQF